MGTYGYYKAKMEAFERVKKMLDDGLSEEEIRIYLLSNFGYGKRTAEELIELSREAGHGKKKPNDLSG